MLIANLTDFGLEEIENIMTVTSLGKNLDKNGSFDKESKKLSFDTLKKYHEKVISYNIEPADVILTATEASRVASDAHDFYQDIKSKFNFEVNIINSEGEAFYTALGVSLGSKNANLKEISNMDKGESLIIDIGGASTELIKLNNSPFEILKSISLPIGSVRASDYSKDNKYQEKFDLIIEKFDISYFKSSNVICVAGNMTTLACMLLSLDDYSKNIHTKTFSVKEIQSFYDRIENLTPSMLLQDYSYIGKRSETIVAGTKVILTLASIMEIKNIEISVFGLRHGTLYEGHIDERFTS